MRRAGPAFVLAALLGMAGCGSNEEEEYKICNDLTVQQIAVMDEVSDILATIKTPAQMEAARPELMKRYERIDQLVGKFQKQGKMSDAVAARIERSLGDRIVAASTRLRRQGAEVVKLPGGEEFLRSLKPLN